MIMIVGFTGTRKGMTEPQSLAVGRLILDATEFHHGLCVGADEQAHKIAWEELVPIIGHPPIKDALLAKIPRSDFKAIREPRDYLQRNRDIVDETQLLVAAPHGPEEKRSGTWSTVRYARTLERPIAVCWPDGNVSYQNPNKLVKP